MIKYNPVYNDTPASDLTIRQHFASMAMQGLCVSCETMEAENVSKLFKHWQGKYGAASKLSECIAMDAVEIADALIAELNKP